MNKLQKVLDKLFIKQWTIGVSYIDPENFEKNGIDDLNFFWIPIDSSKKFFADPFVFKNPNGNIHIVYEDYTHGSFGKISVKVLDTNFNIITTKRILDIGSHLSYPNVFFKENKIFIIPESSKDNNLHCYEYDFSEDILINKKTIIPNEPLLDSTILEYNGKYWLFATKRGAESNNKLYIYHSDRWDGGYVPHKKNPIKNSFNGSRPAGNFIQIGKNIYRPAQNSIEYYGKSISVFKLVNLNENEFTEEHFFDIRPPQNTKFKFAIHTINISDNVIVVDGLRRIFNPFNQVLIALQKLFKINKIEQ